MAACSGARSLCSLHRGTAHGTPAGWDGHHPPSLKQALGKIPFNPAPGGPPGVPGEGLYLTAGSPYRSSPEKPTASRISRQKILFQALGDGEGRHNIFFIPMFIFIHTQISICTYKKLFVQFNVSFYVFAIGHIIFTWCRRSETQGYVQGSVLPVPRHPAPCAEAAGVSLLHVLPDSLCSDRRCGKHGSGCSPPPASPPFFFSLAL